MSDEQAQEAEIEDDYERAFGNGKADPTYIDSTDKPGYDGPLPMYVNFRRFKSPRMEANYPQDGKRKCRERDQEGCRCSPERSKWVSRNVCEGPWKIPRAGSKM